MINLPAYVWALIFFAAVGVPAATCLSLYRGGLSARAAVLTGMVFGGWITASALLADSGAYHAKSASSVPWFAVAFAATLTVCLAATRLPAISRALAGPDTAARLATPHTLRVAGVAFLIAAELGHLPAAFALPAGLGDIAVGLSAPFVARRLARGGRDARRGALWFNILGLLDLAVALAMGVLTGIGAQQILHVTPSSEALSLLPLALIPTTAVPLLAALHIISLRRLPTSGEPTADHRASAPSTAGSVHSSTI